MSKEEILKSWDKNQIFSKTYFELATLAMQEYADQQTKPLIDEIEELEKNERHLSYQTSVYLEQMKKYEKMFNEEHIYADELRIENIQLQAKIDDALKQLDELIESSTKNAQMFYESNNTTSQIGCDAMATAYNECKKLLTNNPKTN